MRNLDRPVGGRGPITWLGGHRVLEFGVQGYPVPDFKPGATIYHDSASPSPILVTIQGGAGHTWTVDQPMPGTAESAQSCDGYWYSSMITAARGRNSGGTIGSSDTIAGQLVPD